MLEIEKYERSPAHRAANLAAEAVRYMIYATPRTLDRRADVYGVAALATCVGSMPQACDQLAEYLAERLEARRLCLDEGGDVADQVGFALAALETVTERAAELTRALWEAHDAVAHVAGCLEEDH